MPADRRRITLAIAAMGGQGGGVLADWIVETAERSGYFAQATSVPGVAQRTGSTIYYLELFPQGSGETEPVLALMPVPGDVDVVIAAELAEAGRAVQRGIVTPDRTVLIASSHRAYALVEKSAMSDGRKSTAATLAAIEKASQRLICADMQALADAHRTVISATLFGALAGSGALPFERAAFEAAIKGTGKAVENNLAAFDAAFALSGSEPPAAPAARIETVPAPAKNLPQNVALLLRRVEQEVRPEVRASVLNGLRRVVDYQDTDYGRTYLDRFLRIEKCAAAAAPDAARQRFAEALAAGLALWMSYEDTIRVADLKIRRERFARCREEVRAGKKEIVYLTEFMHPRIEEVADTLPAAAGRWLLSSAFTKSLLNRFVLRERKISTSKIGGFLLLYGLAKLRRFRRVTYRFEVEQARIERWLGVLAEAAARDVEFATEIALCQNLIKGYGDTHARGWRNFERIMQVVERHEAVPNPAARVRELREAALADEQGERLEASLSRVA